MKSLCVIVLVIVACTSTWVEGRRFNPIKQVQQSLGSLIPGHKREDPSQKCVVPGQESRTDGRCWLPQTCTKNYKNGQLFMNGKQLNGKACPVGQGCCLPGPASTPAVTPTPNPLPIGSGSSGPIASSATGGANVDAGCSKQSGWFTAKQCLTEAKDGNGNPCYYAWSWSRCFSLDLNCNGNGECQAMKNSVTAEPGKRQRGDRTGTGANTALFCYELLQAERRRTVASTGEVVAQFAYPLIYNQWGCSKFASFD